MRYADLIRKVFFWPSIVYLIIVLWTITLGQRVPLEFQDSTLRNEFYDFVWWFTPIAILITMSGTIRRKHSQSRIFITGAITILSIPIFVIYMFSFRFLGKAAWRTTEITHVHSTDPDHRIEEQYIDLGISSGRRTVEIKPISKLFYMVRKVDSLTLKDSNWIPINSED